MVNPEPMLAAAERAWNLLLGMAQGAHAALRSQRYEVLTRNMMDMGGCAIQTQSRIRKRKTVWEVEFDGSPLWVQVQSFWSMPVGSPLYICRRARVRGRQRVLFRTTASNRQLRFWAERMPDDAA